MDFKQLLSMEFWKDSTSGLLAWLIDFLPFFFLLLVILFVSFRLVNFFLKRMSSFFINRAIHSETTNEFEAEKRIKTLIGILRGIFKIVIWLIVIFMLLKRIGLDITPVLAGAGILGLAIGFGAQELVRDFISGFFILLENQIRAGDVAIINGTGGLVEKIELRTTTLRDFSGVVHVFQNGKIDTISNMTKEWSAMVFDMGVAYKEDPDKVMDVMVQVGKELQEDEIFGPKIIEPIEMFGVNEFGDSAVVIRARLKTKPIEQWSVGREYRRRLKKAFDKAGIEIPFPHRTVYWGEEIKPLKMETGNSSGKTAKLQ